MAAFTVSVIKIASLLSTYLLVAHSHPAENNINELSFGDPQASGSLGGRAKKYQFPHQVSLQIPEKNSYKHICSGAILSVTWVVSTAYCTTPFGDFRIVAGLISQDETDVDVQIVQVEKVVVHPHYKGQISENDIALLKLQTPLALTKSAQPIYVAPRGSQEENVWGKAVLSEWTVQTHLQKHFSFNNLYYMVVQVMKEAKCAYALRHYNFAPEKMLCTEESGDALFCPGESGAPLVLGGALVGITSWGFVPCGTTVFTKISFYMDFIEMFVDDL